MAPTLILVFLPHAKQQVHAAAMSPAMRVHSLVAVGTDDRRVRLCDLKSGGA
jgi:hypothetical protein